MCLYFICYILGIFQINIYYCSNARMHEKMKKIRQRLGLRKSVPKSHTYNEGLRQYAIPENEPAQILNGGYSDYTLNSTTNRSGKLRALKPSFSRFFYCRFKGARPIYWTFFIFPILKEAIILVYKGAMLLL